ncbi:alpha/beta fold hydrolase [Nocardia cyriacigeorgica]|uniref:Alpha/beta fold hydrolase n=1 Tax=Nocardia cyriacigeorgica TaxID=135487 RepID=A0ABX0CFR1_9NOCA|nr:alpha/beta hydrolase [Nocardia cyriacigeorgica]NEW55391.1 alpha/beta fold hydrolase [Nocardia cyriacigeorgica]
MRPRVDGIVLIHGVGSDIADSFGETVGWLGDHTTVVPYHLPGSGGRPVEGPLALESVVREVRAAAGTAGLSRYVPVGSSTGSAVAVAVAHAARSEVAGLVATAGFAHADSSLRLALDVWDALLDHPDPEVPGRYLTLVDFGTSWLRSASEEVITETYRAVATGLPPGTSAQLDLARSIDVRDLLHEIEVPALVVAGDEDRLVPPHLSAELAAGLSGAELVTVRSGHAWSQEAPRVWCDLVVGFLERL